MVELSIIVLSYNTKELLKRCLESVVREIRGIGCVEVIVVDNGSTDGSGEYLKTQMSKLKTESQNLKLKIILNRGNLGFAKGNNQGIKEASGKYILFLNSDTAVKDGAINLLVNYLNNNPQVAAVSPLILNKDGSVQKDPCYLKFPSSLFAIFYYNRFFKILANRYFPQFIYSTRNFSVPSQIDQLPGAALMIRKNVFNKIGGFDEGYIHFFEDVDLSWRLKKDGYNLFLVPEAKIVHFGGKSLEPIVKKEGVKSYYYLNFKSLFRFCKKNYSNANFFLIKSVVFLQMLLRLRLSLIRKLFF